MLRRLPALLPLLIVVAAILGACAGKGSTGAMTMVPITDFAMVAGKWAGLMSGITARQEDWVELRITTDGKYDFGSYRQMGGLGGSGSLTLSNGTLQSRTETGTTTYTLYQGGDKRILQAQSVLPDGRQLSAKLTRQD